MSPPWSNGCTPTKKRPGLDRRQWHLGKFWEMRRGWSCEEEEFQWFILHIWLVVFLEHDWLIFPSILGMSSSELTNSYFSEGLKPPTRYILWKTIRKPYRNMLVSWDFVGYIILCHQLHGVRLKSPVSEWRFLARKITELNGPFSNTPCLMTGWYIHLHYIYIYIYSIDD